MSTESKDPLRNYYPLITKIVFYNYKNIEYGDAIHFSKPLTAIVGANGTNKSSILQALYGCPNKKTIADFWFSTAIDPIKIKKLDKDRPRVVYFYRRNLTDTDSNCPCINLYRAPRKKSSTKRADPDYWEPGRASADYGMTIPPNKERRWPLIDKDVIYLDFRSMLSAYDIMFHYGIFNKTANINSVQDFIRRRSKSMAVAIRTGKREFHRKKRLFTNIDVANTELQIISNILGRNYTGAKVLKHSFFRDKESTTVIFKNNNQYSEAYAGSGEFAVVKLVLSISQANPRTLILLDEPETSLHPGAQIKLVEYLLHECEHKHHQIVISTHSPTIIQLLDKDSIKLVDINQTNNKVYITENVPPQLAFHAIGHFPEDKWTIIVEDELSAAIIKRAIIADDYLKTTVEVYPVPGGADTIMNRYIPAIMLLASKKTIVFLDGDKYKTDAPDTTTIAQSEYPNLQTKIFEITGISNIKFNKNGGKASNQQDQQRRNNQEIDHQLLYLQFFHDFVRYLPGIGETPEDWLKNCIEKETNSLSGKDYFVSKAKNTQYTSTPASKDIFFEEQIALNSIDPCSNTDLEQIKKAIKTIIER